MVSKFETPEVTEDSGHTTRVESERIIDTGGNRPTVADLIQMLSDIEDKSMEIVAGVSLPDENGKMVNDTIASLEITEAGVVTRADNKQFVYLGVHLQLCWPRLRRQETENGYED